MRDIEPVQTYGSVNEDDVRRALNGLQKGVRYAASDLYARYSDAAREAGRQPGHPVGLGQVFARWGLVRAKITQGGPGAGRGRSGRGRQVTAWEIPWSYQ
jgi:hypothetical protein